MDRERDTHVIYFKDLLFSVLYRWRTVLLTALIFALLLGGYRVARGWSAVTPSDGAASQQEALLNDQMTILQSKLQEQIAYLEGSVVMRLNPYRVCTADMEVFIDADYRVETDAAVQRPDYTADIVQAYSKLLFNREILTPVAQALDMDVDTLSEMLYVEKMNYTLTVRVYHTSQESAMAILEKLEGCLPQMQEQISRQIIPHSARVSARSAGYVVDEKLLERQKKAEEAVTELRTEIANQLAQIAALSAQTGANGMRPKQVVKYAVLGAILGAFASAGVICVMHIGRGKVYSARTLADRTGVHVLGGMPAPDTGRNPIDRWLRRLERRAVSAPELVAADIANCAAGKTLLLCGGCGGESRELLARALHKAGVKTVSCGSLLQDIAALQALPGCDVVVLAEQCNASYYTDISRQVQRIADQGKKLLGCVLIDG